MTAYGELWMRQAGDEIASDGVEKMVRRLEHLGLRTAAEATRAYFDIGKAQEIRSLWHAVELYDTGQMDEGRFSLALRPWAQIEGGEKVEDGSETSRIEERKILTITTPKGVKFQAQLNERGTCVCAVFGDGSWEVDLDSLALEALTGLLQ